MKKVTLLFFVLIAFHCVTAQVTFRPGVRGGLNISSISNTHGRMIADFYAGGYLAIHFTKVYTLQPEIIYSRQGGSVRFGDANTNGDYDPNVGGSTTFRKDVHIDFIGLNIVNKFYVTKGLHLMAGTFLDINQGANKGYDVPDTDLGILTGIGYTLPNGISLDVRYKQGFADVLGNYGYSNNLYDNTQLNEVIQIGLTYTFKFKK
jgi:hypothetical protein